VRDIDERVLSFVPILILELRRIEAHSSTLLISPPSIHLQVLKIVSSYHF